MSQDEVGEQIQMLLQTRVHLEKARRALVEANSGATGGTYNQILDALDSSYANLIALEMEWESKGEQTGGNMEGNTGDKPDDSDDDSDDDYDEYELDFVDALLQSQLD